LSRQRWRPPYLHCAQALPLRRIAARQSSLFSGIDGTKSRQEHFWRHARVFPPTPCEQKGRIAYATGLSFLPSGSKIDQARRPSPKIRPITMATRKTKNRICAIEVAAPATPVKP